MNRINIYKSIKIYINVTVSYLLLCLSFRVSNKISILFEFQYFTLSRPGGHRCPLSPKFQLYFKKGSLKKFPMSVTPMSR